MRQRDRDRARARAVRLAVFGGTFDPPHVGHLALAERAADALALDRVLFVPARVPPHKRHAAMTPARHRLAMVRLAVRGNPRFAVSTLELVRPGPSYTVDTLRALGRRHPRAELFLLIGADSL
ncbi:MAG TPA: nicotinate (nicotinamide) nucleotide adenylyltransferase, partial [Candidatus Eisenbacteria bacterium]|nr:nicotinate (nicotinamide) nucleotide adenylyltransferase [Candidatus Eisenbacteria bacterium]